MDIAFYRGLLVNGMILLSASILYTFVYGFYNKRKKLAEVYIGVIGGAVGILVLMTTVHGEGGVIVDTRSVLVSTIGMLFGWVPALVASGVIIATRIIMGGGGTFTGVLVTCVSAATGLLWRELRLKNGRLGKKFAGLEFYITGVLVSALMLICMLTLPREAVFSTLRAISLPVMLIYPLLTLLVCMVIWLRLRQIQADEDLLNSEARFRALYEQAPIGVAFEDGQGQLRSNATFGRILGKPAKDFMPGEWPVSMEFLPEKSGVPVVAEGEYIRPNGEKAWVQTTRAALEMVGEPGSGRLLVLQDITQRKQREEEIAYLTYHDVLTGMYNRAFLEKERAYLDTAEFLPLSVILGDVNGLKLINDAFGHDAGDVLLKRAAGILKGSLRPRDILARTGGDEFLVLLPNTDEATVLDIYQRINASLSESGAGICGEPCQVSISLGYATKTDGGQSLADVIRTAEKYMYRRKLLAHKDLYTTVLTSVKETLYENSDETKAHGERMAALAKIMGDRLHLPGEDMAALELASVLHDIGKVRVDFAIMRKAGMLNNAEWDEIKRHPEAGSRIAQSIPHLNAIADVILYHHERWDGTGYPNGLKGDQIPLLSRILNLVDAFDTMREDRDYRKAMSEEDAAREILDGAGKQFDPYLARVFVENVLREGKKAPGGATEGTV